MEMMINNAKRTIEMTKTFAKKASIYGTEEYEKLQNVRRDYPMYTVTIKKEKSSDNLKGLTNQYMEKYIKNHDDEETLADFYILIGRNADGTRNVDAIDRASYGEVKQWFLNLHPEIDPKSQRNRINEILNKAKNKNSESRDTAVIAKIA